MMQEQVEQEFVAKWEGKFKKVETGRRRFEKQWHLNLAFYFGDQYVQWVENTTSGLGYSLIIPKVDKHRVRLVSNRIRPMIRKEVAKIGKTKAHFGVVPSTTDDKDIAKAKTAKGIATHLLTDDNFDKKKREAIWWASLTGVGHWKTTMVGQDVFYQDVSTFHFWVSNPEIKFVQEQEFVVHGLNLSVEAVKHMFEKEVQADSKSASPDQRYYQTLGLSKSDQVNDSVFVKEFWVKPNHEFPQGAMFIIGGGQLLYFHEAEPEPEIDPATGMPLADPQGNIVPKEQDPLNYEMRGAYPYAHGQYPFQKIDHISAGRYYSTSVIEDVIPLQKEYNRGRSQVIEHINMVVKPKWNYTRGSVNVSKINNVPGEHIDVAPGFEAPKPVQNPQLDQTPFQNMQQNIADMDFISNQFEISQGRTPPNVEAASAIAFLQEESDSVLEDIVTSLEEAVESSGYQSLELVKQFWDSGTIVKIASGVDLYEVIEYKDGSLSEEIDFKVERGSMMPNSAAAQRAFIMELVQMGLIPPMEGLKYLEMSTTNRLYEDMQIDARQQRRENYKMEQGQPVEINQFDNHEAHIVTMERFMKSQEYEMLQPEIQQHFVNHWSAHMKVVADNAMAAMEQQIAMNAKPEQEKKETANAGSD